MRGLLPCNRSLTPPPRKQQTNVAHMRGKTFWAEKVFLSAAVLCGVGGEWRRRGGGVLFAHPCYVLRSSSTTFPPEWRTRTIPPAPYDCKYPSCLVAAESTSRATRNMKARVAWPISTPSARHTTPNAGAWCPRAMRYVEPAAAASFSAAGRTHKATAGERGIFKKRLRILFIIRYYAFSRRRRPPIIREARLPKNACRLSGV